MQSKEYFKKLMEQGKITDEEYVKFIDTVPEFEVPDKVFQVLDSTFLTPERALTHKDVAGRLRREIMDPVDKNIKGYLKYLSADDVLAIEREESTYKKMQLLDEAIPRALKKAEKAPNDEESKKKLTEAQQVINDLTEKFSKIEAEKEKNAQSLKSEYDKKIKEFQLNVELEKLANSYTFADVFAETRNDLTKTKLDAIKSKHRLDLVDKNGEAHIQVLDEHGAPIFENNGNTPVTIKSLLDGSFKPFLKVNNTGDGDQGNGNNGQQQTQAKKFTVQDPNTETRRGANVSVTI